MNEEMSDEKTNVIALTAFSVMWIIVTFLVYSLVGLNACLIPLGIFVVHIIVLTILRAKQKESERMSNEEG